MPTLAEDIALAENNSGLTWAQIKLLQRIHRGNLRTWSELARGRFGETRKELRRGIEALVEQGLVSRPERRDGPAPPAYHLFSMSRSELQQLPPPPRYQVTAKGKKALFATSSKRASPKRSGRGDLAPAEIKLLLRIPPVRGGATWSDLAAGCAGPERQQLRQVSTSLLQRGLLARALSRDGYPRFLYGLTPDGRAWRREREFPHD